MKKLFLFGALALALAAGTASAMSSPTYINNCGKKATHPAKLVTACADGNYYLASLKWKNWGKSSSTATGLAWANNCKPNCAAGKFKSYPVAIKASRKVSCHGHRDYTRLEIGYTKSKPAGFPNPDHIKLSCV